jgi:hypothetical protein
MLLNAICSFAGAALGAALVFLLTTRRKKGFVSTDRKIADAVPKSCEKEEIGGETDFIRRVRIAKERLKNE